MQNKNSIMSEDRSDSESSIGPVSGEPLHGYVNLPQNQGQSDPDLESEEVESNGNSLPPPLVAKKDRSRYENGYLKNSEVIYEKNDFIKLFKLTNGNCF